VEGLSKSWIKLYSYISNIINTHTHTHVHIHINVLCSQYFLIYTKTFNSWSLNNYTLGIGNINVRFRVSNVRYVLVLVNGYIFLISLILYILVLHYLVLIKIILYDHTASCIVNIGTHYYSNIILWVHFHGILR